MMWNVLLILVFVFLIVLAWVMLYDSTRFVIRKHTIKHNKISGNYRAVVLADLHNKQYGKNNRLLIDAIKEQKPDGIWIVGDMLTAKPGKKMKPVVAFLAELAKDYPIFYANGNHEHRLTLYPQTYGNMAEEYTGALDGLGIRPMINVHRDLAEVNISVYGAQIDREYFRRFVIPHMEPEYLESILGTPPADMYTVLLAHNPDFFPVYAAWGADLVLSGHVHGGLIRIPGWKGVLSPNIRFFPKYDGGKYEEGDCTMILSRGLGMHTIPVRLFNPGELIVVEFEKASES